jgi:pyruvate,water dikinase
MTRDLNGLALRRIAGSVLTLLALGLTAGCDSDTSDPDSNSDAAAPDGGGDAQVAEAPKIEEGACQIADGDSAEFLKSIPCKADFDALASTPIDANLPGARSVKVVLDQADDDALYFQNSQTYQIHYEFTSTHLSGDGLPLVPSLSEFNTTEYYKPDRRFVLGAVTYYEGADAWVLELAPYDTASAEMIGKLYTAVKAAVYFGPLLKFHPTSQAVEAEAKTAKNLPLLTTDELYEGIQYQPLTLGTSMGRLHFVKAADLDTEYLSYRDIIVLDEVPNDITVVSGLITEQFQTPLSHVNVLSENRGTPNMGLREATSNETLRALDGKWVELEVAAAEWRIQQVTMEEADAYWEAHKPQPKELPALDLSVRGLYDIEDVVPESADVPLRDALKTAVVAFGGKAAHYSILAKTEHVPTPKAFAVPVYYYDRFMRDNGFYDRLDELLQDADFKADPAVRDAELQKLRDDMMEGTLDQDLLELLEYKFAMDYPGLKMRFRTSTNSEDLDGFPCAGCYESHTGDPADWPDVLDAIRETYASIWLFRTFEERSYYGIDHKGVGMALLVHHSFPDEEANGVALTANPFDAAGLEPGFYVNVQVGGDAEVVHPPPGVSSDEFLYFFTSPNQPVTYISHSNLVDDGETVLTTRQIHELGIALDAIHTRFSPAYGPKSGNNGWYAMDVEFKFDGEPGEEPTLQVKQARPHPGRGTD